MYKYCLDLCDLFFRKCKLLWVLLMLMPLALPAQRDTLAVAFEIGLRGRWQTGNLNQLGLNPNARLLLTKNAYSTALKVDYQYLNVNAFTVISDFWMNGLHKFTPRRKLHPIITGNYGFAKSYKIDQSILLGAGVGLNAFQNSAESYLVLNVFAGYLNLHFQGENPHVTFTLGSVITAALPIGERVGLSWELHTYHPGLDSEYWGANNLVSLRFGIARNLFLTATHSTIFNNRTVEGIEKINTLMLFGLQYQIQH